MFNVARLPHSPRDLYLYCYIRRVKRKIPFYMLVKFDSTFAYVCPLAKGIPLSLLSLRHKYFMNYALLVITE